MMTHDSQPLPKFYFVNEVSEMLRRSEASVRWLIHTKQLKTGKLGGRVVISAGELDRFINDAFTNASA